MFSRSSRSSSGVIFCPLALAMGRSPGAGLVGGLGVGTDVDFRDLCLNGLRKETMLSAFGRGFS